MTERVAGTRIERAADDDRSRTLIFSDLHVPQEGGVVLEDLQAILAEARERPADTRVMILGDLFEFVVGTRHLGMGAYRDVVAALRATTRAGVSVTVLHGNRDFLLGRAFAARTGCRVVKGGLRFRVGARSCLALHGDELCLHDHAYQRMKRILRHPVTKGVFHCLPFRWRMRFGMKLRKESQNDAPVPADSTRFDPIESAVREAFATGVDELVFGHIHRPARGFFAAGQSYRVLPAFDAERVLLEADGADLWYRHLAGERLPDPPPRSFPS